VSLTQILLVPIIASKVAVQVFFLLSEDGDTLTQENGFGILLE